jgi:hypothetical protein
MHSRLQNRIFSEEFAVLAFKFSDKSALVFTFFDSY